MIIVNFNTLMSSPKFWDEPEAFRPERFIKDGVVETPENYIPFGLGKLNH